MGATRGTGSITVGDKKLYNARGLRIASGVIRERYADDNTVGAMLRLAKVKERIRVNGVKYFDLEEAEDEIKKKPTQAEAQKIVRAKSKKEPLTPLSMADFKLLKAMDDRARSTEDVAQRTFLLLAEVNNKLDRLVSEFGVGLGETQDGDSKTE